MAKGFSLVEILVAMAIMGIIVAMVSVAAHPDERALLELESTRLAGALALAVKEARLTGDTIVWRSDGTRYAFARYADDGSGTSPDATSDLRPRTLPAGIEIASARQRGDTQLQFVGRAPVELFSIELRAGETRYAVASTAMGDVRASRVGEVHDASR